MLILNFVGVNYLFVSYMLNIAQWVGDIKWKIINLQIAIHRLNPVK